MEIEPAAGGTLAATTAPPATIAPTTLGTAAGMIFGQQAPASYLEHPYQDGGMQRRLGRTPAESDSSESDAAIALMGEGETS